MESANGGANTIRFLRVDCLRWWAKSRKISVALASKFASMPQDFLRSTRIRA
jgi:hypothetical protein